MTISVSWNKDESRGFFADLARQHGTALALQEKCMEDFSKFGVGAPNRRVGEALWIALNEAIDNVLEALLDDKAADYEPLLHIVPVAAALQVGFDAMDDQYASYWMTALEEIAAEAATICQQLEY